VSTLITQGQGDSIPNPDKIESDLVRLLEALAKLAKQCDEHAGENRDELRHHATGFALKLYRHAASALTLVRECSAVEPQDRRFLDAPSVSTIARAAWESFLLFHHIFIGVADDDERTMRYRRWLIAGVRFRQGYEALDPEQQRRKNEESEMIGAWEEEVRANPAFQRSSPDFRRHFLTRKGWHPGWSDLAASADIVKQHGHDHYSHLCDYAHSGSLSVIGQMDDQDRTRIQLFRVTAAGIIAIAVANVIAGLGTLFPVCSNLIGPEEKGLVEWWVRIGHGHEPQGN